MKLQHRVLQAANNDKTNLQSLKRFPWLSEGLAKFVQPYTQFLGREIWMLTSVIQR
jgi:hypothetical protein